MANTEELLATIRGVNKMSAFNTWCGIEVVRAESGEVDIAMPWREEAGQYAGFLHAGIVGALVDTACGFAAATVVGHVLASHYHVNFLRPAVGSRFLARAKVIRHGRSLAFTSCELFAEEGGSAKLVATGETLLSVVPRGTA